jgi:hypothetical protein
MHVTCTCISNWNNMIRFDWNTSTMHENNHHTANDIGCKLKSSFIPHSSKAVRCQAKRGRTDQLDCRGTQSLWVSVVGLTGLLNACNIGSGPRGHSGRYGRERLLKTGVHLLHLDQTTGKHGLLTHASSFGCHSHRLTSKQKLCFILSQ